MENKVVLVYDKLNHPNCSKERFNHSLAEIQPAHYIAKGMDTPEDSVFDLVDGIEKTARVYYSGIADKFDRCELKSLDDKALGGDTMYCYILEPFGGLGNFLGQNDNYTTGALEDLGEEVIAKLTKLDNFYVLIAYPHEATVGEGELHAMHKSIDKTPITPEKVIFMMNRNWSIVEKYEKMCSLNNINSKLNLIFFDYFLYEKGEESNENNFYSNREFLKQKRNNKIVCLNRRLINRWHRMLILAMAHRDNLLKQNLISFNFQFEGEKIHYRSKPIGSKTYITKDEFKTNIEILQKQGKRVIDEVNMDIISGFRFEDSKTYTDSYISFITETMFFEDVNFMTEKSLKPLIHFHPFVIVGRPGTLECLRSMGFKTFSDYWDESYDDTVNNTERFKKIYDLFLKFNNMTFDELHSLYLELIPILEHNFELISKYGVEKQLGYDKLISDIYQCIK